MAGDDLTSIILPIWLGCFIASCVLGGQRGHPTIGAFTGLFLGPLGLLITAVLPRTPAAQARHEFEVERLKAQLRQQAAAAAEQEQQRATAAWAAQLAATTEKLPPKSDRVLVCPVCSRPNPVPEGAATLNCRNCGEVLNTKMAELNRQGAKSAKKRTL